MASVLISVKNKIGICKSLNKATLALRDIANWMALIVYEWNEGAKRSSYQCLNLNNFAGMLLGKWKDAGSNEECNNTQAAIQTILQCVSWACWTVCFANLYRNARAASHRWNGRGLMSMESPYISGNNSLYNYNAVVLQVIWTFKLH